MFKDKIFTGKTVLITGGGTGLGKSMARQYAEFGANLVLASRKQEVLDRAAAEIEQDYSVRILPISLDIRSYREIDKAVHKILDTYGKIDILVNNAAGNFISPTEKLSYKAFDTVVDIVLRGTYNMSLALGKYWIGQNIPGLILNIVTTYAFTGSGYVVPSSVSKAGVLNLTRSLAAEWGKYNIRINAIAPGPFPTKGAWERLFPDPSWEKKLINRIPLKRVGEHQELTNLACYLTSPYAGYITGEVVTIDGGEWLAGAGEFNFLNELTNQDWEKLEKLIKR